MAEYKFTPGSVTVEQGATVSVPNGGALQHDLKLRKSGKVVGGTELVDAGQSVDFEVDVKPGSYEMLCSVPGHEEGGMKGEFTVKSALEHRRLSGREPPVNTIEVTIVPGIWFE